MTFTTGFYDAAARAAGQLGLEECQISAIDTTGDPEYTERLHELGFGSFELPPQLAASLRHLSDALTEPSPEAECWIRVCERGALHFLQRTLLSAGVGVPCFEWAHATDRTCTRFAEAHAAFAHTDLRVDGLTMYNIWVPLCTEVVSEPLLLFVAASQIDCSSWREPRDKAHHLPRHCAEDGEWRFFSGMGRGRCVIFPGDGGAEGRIFHASASATTGHRRSFDVREFVVPAGDKEASDALVWHDAEERLAREETTWLAEARDLMSRASRSGGAPVERETETAGRTI